ncbi:large subunit ribosomal protein L18 [Arenibacter algicola]|jgi:large subunit ribosomal protein L18|uniref:Large ribosomal subunit protein uL18 n=1 Tax=Arenibacter algicola TaxID=616991 RepID=A0A221UR76_9FLAO|nr:MULTISPECIES: 50S ribosomal protein L18 [Arenibacter]ASO03802.1 50S ribosomal protein L18 [Arenibacter algicola]GBF18895.1 50S ribosomal protein L18 [Arenibacter sp. NBRC 103722]HCO84465.1 50S ribosomal protein L18 [Arenibacter sp.]|tara:strand:+ start:19245 stop:19601 length:357 start_codon:yes stop_codon:yes gene_type:complete
MGLTKTERRLRIRRRIRKISSGTAERPRLAVFRSNTGIYAQIIDDVAGTTLVSASSRDKELAKAKGTKTEVANLVGKAIAEKAKEAGIEAVAFDRGGNLYHGRVKSLADGAREAGLKF